MRNKLFPEIAKTYGESFFHWIISTKNENNSITIRKLFPLCVFFFNKNMTSTWRIFYNVYEISQCMWCCKENLWILHIYFDPTYSKKPVVLVLWFPEAINKPVESCGMISPTIKVLQPYFSIKFIECNGLHWDILWPQLRDHFLKGLPD